MTRKQRFRENWIAIKEGCVQGAKETPRKFFAPLIVLARWMSRISDEGMGPPLATFTLTPRSKSMLFAAAERLGISPSSALEIAIKEFGDRTQTNASSR